MSSTKTSHWSLLNLIISMYSSLTLTYRLLNSDSINLFCCICKRASLVCIRSAYQSWSELGKILKTCIKILTWASIPFHAVYWLLLPLAIWWQWNKLNCFDQQTITAASHLTLHVLNVSLWEIHLHFFERGRMRDSTGRGRREQVGWERLKERGEEKNRKRKRETRKRKIVKG